MSEAVLYVRFDPQPDITAYELAVALPWTHGSFDKDIAIHIPNNLRRHFTCIYNPTDAEAVRIANLFQHTELDKGANEQTN